jgi:hypothetical protein
MKEAMKLAKNKGKLVTFSNLSNYNEKYDPKGLNVYVQRWLELKKFYQEQIMQFF